MNCKNQSSRTRQVKKQGGQDRADFGIVTFRQILAMEVVVTLGSFASPKQLKIIERQDESPARRNTTQEGGPPIGESSPAHDTDIYLSNAEKQRRGIPPRYRVIRSTVIPDVTIGRYITSVNARGEIHIAPYPRVMGNSHPSVVSEDDQTISIDRTMRQEKLPLKPLLDPELLDDLKNATRCLDLDLQNVLEHAARLELANLELLHKEGNPFTPRRRSRGEGA